MKTITKWSQEEQTINWGKINEIVKHNKKHFFSVEFFNSVVNELKNNLKIAFDELETTNTSKTFINFRKTQNTLPEMSEENRQIRINAKEDLVATLLKARSYYKRYLKSLE